jgi:hypothetical protein
MENKNYYIDKFAVVDENVEIGEEGEAQIAFDMVSE